MPNNKISVLVASEHALPTAFTVFRGLRQGFEDAARLGYDGIELAVRGGSEFSAAEVRGLLSEYGLGISAISTGQVFADRGLWLSAKDEAVSNAAIGEFNSIVDMASELGCLVNIGRARGFIEGGEAQAETTRRFAKSMGQVAAHAKKRGVAMVIEPVNRYETNYINSVGEGAALLAELEACGIGCLGLMPDLFHMNIEDASMEGSLRKYAKHIKYVHLADSNRLAPGWGHTDFKLMLDTLDDIGYDGWYAVEILPRPDPESAAKQAIEYIKSIGILR